MIISVLEDSYFFTQGVVLLKKIKKHSKRSTVQNDADCV